MHIGKRIRYLRIKNNLSQEELAKGIISVSHLSNLESGRYSASKETIKFLAKRLHVHDSYLLDCFTINTTLENVLEQLFISIVTDVHNVSSILDSIDQPINCISQECIYFYLTCSYYYKINEIDRAQTIENNILTYLSVDVSKQDVPDNLKQAYYYFKGLSSYRMNQLESSYHFFKKLLDYIYLENIYADIQFNLALISYQLADYFNAKKYTDLATKIYMDDGDLDKLAITHNLVGTIFCDSYMFKDALSELNKAMKFSKALNFERLQSRILHNKGQVYKGLKNDLKALEQFKKSYQLKMRIQSKDILVTIIEIIKCHLSLGQYNEAKQLARASSQFMTTERDYHLLTSLKGNIDLYEGNENGFIKKKKDALHYFITNKLIKNASGIAKELGDYYYKINKYKNAAIYYRMELDQLNEEKGGEN